MNAGVAGKAIHSALRAENIFCKFLSANDTGATGGHQSGILISKSAMQMMFDEKELEHSTIPKKTVEIHWQDEEKTESNFTYYRSKNELRITRFGRNFPFLYPDQTGALFVFLKMSEGNYCGYFLETEDEIEEFLDTFGLSPTETNALVHKEKIFREKSQEIAIERLVNNLDIDFPSSERMATAAREIEEEVYNHRERIISNPDEKLLRWTNVEFAIFRKLEHLRYEKKIQSGFSSVDEFIQIANTVLNRRKSRAGKSLEHHLAAIFDANGIDYSQQAITEGNKKPDFLFPSQEAYLDFSYSAERLLSLAAKTTCKDRWRQILNEADRLKDRPKYLCTLQQGISTVQMDEMEKEKVVLVVPKPYIASYPKERRDRIWTVQHFVEFVKELEGK